MQTFLPYPDFSRSAACLDDKRLGNQRREALIILRSVLHINKGWQHHPAVQMWRGHPGHLYLYTYEVCWEWTMGRGFKDTCLRKACDAIKQVSLPTPRPIWLGDSQLHSSHRAALLAKDPEWYRQFGWTETPKIQYFWPSNTSPPA